MKTRFLISTVLKICENRPKQGINVGANSIKLIMHIAAFPLLLMPFSLTNCQKC